MTRTLIAACGAPVVARLRKTFPATPDVAASSAMQRRGRRLIHGELSLVELPPILPDDGAASQLPASHIAAELAYYVGSCPTCVAVLMVIPGQRLVLADRIIAPGCRELIPDLLEPTSRIDPAVEVTAIDVPVVWTTAEWALRRLGPHQFWVVGLPVQESIDSPNGAAPHDDSPHDAAASATHRALRSVVAALEEQNR